MTLAVLIAILAVGLGAALMLASASSPRVLGPLRTFAAVAALSVVILHLLPESLQALGGRAAVAFVLALIAPAFLHWLGERHARGDGHEPAPGGQRVELEISYAGLVAHHVGDGAGIGAYSALPGGASAHLDVIIALVAHTMPLVAVIALAYSKEFGPRTAAFRIAGLALASVVGVVLTFVVPLDRVEAANAWVGAVASGLLLHVVTHDLRSDPPATLTARLVDLIAVAAGIAVATLGAEHGAPLGPSGLNLVERGYGLLLKAALPFAVGLGAVLLLNAASKRIPKLDPPVSGVFTSAVLGAVRALLRPFSRRHEGPAANVAYFLAAPAVGLEVLALTVGFFGLEFSALRFAAALLIPVIVAIVVALFPGAKVSEGQASPSTQTFDAWFDHSAVALGLGVIAAALLDTYLPSGSLLASSASPLELSVVSLIALVAALPAPAAVVLTWVLVQKGLSPGAALIALAAGPLFGLRALHALQGTVGTSRAALAVLWTIALCWALAFLQNRHGSFGALFESPKAAPSPLELVSQVALALLALLVMRRVVLVGTRLWLSALAIRS